MKCLICKDSKDYTKLGKHVWQTHKIKYKNYYDTYLKEELDGLCEKCGKSTRFSPITKSYTRFCSKKCANSAETTKQNRIKTCLEKYGVSNASQSKLAKDTYKQNCLKKYGLEHVPQTEEIRQKKKDTCLERYGVEHSSQSKEIQQKIINNNLEKYGVPYIAQVEKFKQKKEATFLKKYGINNPSKLDEVKVKISKANLKLASSAKVKRAATNIKKYGIDYPLKNFEIKAKGRRTKFNRLMSRIVDFLRALDSELVDIPTYAKLTDDLKCRCLKCNTIFLTTFFNLYQGCGKCPNCYQKGSFGEKQIVSFIKELNINIVENSRKLISPLELDIYIPEKQIAIEYNGIYWHSEKQKSDKNYHLNKLNLCQDKKITLIQIFEDEWLLHQDIVKHRLMQIFGVNSSQRVHARSCTIKLTPSNVKNEFLSKYHLQGTDNSPVSLGAFYKDALVAVMTFNHGSLAKGIKNKKEDVWELNRYCCDYNFHIPGIASKLLSFFKNNYEWSMIYSYADRRWSVGNMYYKLGFTLDKETLPNYWYVPEGTPKRIHRFAFKKRPDEPRNIPEWLLRMQEGYTRIWDCGNLKFVMQNECSPIQI
jgi:hypothetical protein